LCNARIIVAFDALLLSGLDLQAMMSPSAPGRPEPITFPFKSSALLISGLVTMNPRRHFRVDILFFMFDKLPCGMSFTSARAPFQGGRNWSYIPIVNDWKAFGRTSRGFCARRPGAVSSSVAVTIYDRKVAAMIE